jgi:hypothetical protein
MTQSFQQRPRELFDTIEGQGPYERQETFEDRPGWPQLQHQFPPSARSTNLPGYSQQPQPAARENSFDSQRLEELVERKTEEGHPIKCICAYRDGGGDVVRCDNCETWQHVECYYPNQNVPKLHLCADCEPRPLDRKAATERQKYRGEQPNEIAEAIEEHSPRSSISGFSEFAELAKRVLDQGKLGKMPSSTGDLGTARDDDDAHRSKAAPAASFTSGYTETDETAIETDDELDSKADDDFAMRVRDERIRAPTLRASQHPEDPPGNDDRLGSTRDSSSFEESHADRPLPRTPRYNTPVQRRDSYGSLI